jgi:hypothetical protein
VPEVCRFYGIVIRLYYRDHPPTHFHAEYGEHEALIEIETGRFHYGSLPRTAAELVERWRVLHIEELRLDWQLARQRMPLLKIEPLA